jgi:hypothetical protein
MRKVRRDVHSMLCSTQSDPGEIRMLHAVHEGLMRTAASQAAARLARVEHALYCLACWHVARLLPAALPLQAQEEVDRVLGGKAKPNMGP